MAALVSSSFKTSASATIVSFGRDPVLASYLIATSLLKKALALAQIAARNLCPLTSVESWAE